MPDQNQITNARFLYVDGRIVMRLYCGGKYEDAVISPGALSLMVGDGARIMAAVFQDQAARLVNK